MSDEQKAKKRKPRPLTKKQAKLARLRVTRPHDTLDEIGRAAGYTGGKSTVKHTLDRPAVAQRIQDLQAKFHELMDKDTRLNMKKLIRRLGDGVEADRTEFFAQEVTSHYEVMKDEAGSPVLDSKGKPKLRAVKKLQIEARTAPDMPVRHSFLRTALEARRVLDKRVDVTSNGNTIKDLLSDE
jgi:hypothetical protein